MADEQRPPGLLISKAIQSERQSSREADLTQLGKTLAKSSLWKANTLKRIEKARSETRNVSNEDVLQSLKRSLLQLVDQHRQAFDTEQAASDGSQLAQDLPEPVDRRDDAARDARLRNEHKGLQMALAQQAREVTKARRQLRERETAIQERGQEVERLRRTIARLQEENSILNARHEHDLDGERTRIVELQQAYDQFQKQSDQLLSELEDENLRLRGSRTQGDEEPPIPPVRLNS